MRGTLTFAPKMVSKYTIHGRDNSRRKAPLPMEALVEPWLGYVGKGNGPYQALQGVKDFTTPWRPWWTNALAIWVRRQFMWGVHEVWRSPLPVKIPLENFLSHLGEKASTHEGSHGMGDSIVVKSPRGPCLISTRQRHKSTWGTTTRGAVHCPCRPRDFALGVGQSTWVRGDFIISYFSPIKMGIFYRIFKQLYKIF